jgi:glycosyltransferase involved in cell wall biosynthesis
MKNHASYCAGLKTIIVDSQSVDNTSQIASMWCDKLGSHRCQYYKIEKRSQAAKRKFGVRMAKGDIVCTLDSDGYWSQHVLRECIEKRQQGYRAVWPLKSQEKSPISQ